MAGSGRSAVGFWQSAFSYQLSAVGILGVIVAASLAAQVPQPPSTPQPRAPEAPARDTSARPKEPPPPQGRISGRVVAGDSGRPIKRARVLISAPELPGGRGTLTDDSGVFEFVELPPGRYTVTASKSGFVSLSYGQRRPLQGGMPLQLNEGQYLKGVDIQLPKGSVLGGRLLDEDGDPMPGVAVRVMRYQYMQGDRRLILVSNAQTDDRGQFRIWGLMPGEYYINAVPRNNWRGWDFTFQRGASASGAGGVTSGNDPESMNYAPTYYPGVSSLSDAKAVVVGISQELLDLNFAMQLVRMSRVEGHVANPDGSPATGGSVNLAVDVSGGRGNQIGQNFGAQIQWDGAFELPAVPPGRYTLRARSDDTGEALYAASPLSVSDVEMDDLTVFLQKGAAISGTVTFLGGSSPPDVRIVAPATDQSTFGPLARGNVERDGTFTITGVSPGTHLIRLGGGLRGWTLKSVTVDGKDQTDTPFETRSGQQIQNVAVFMTDRLSELSGIVMNSHGLPAPDYTVLAFPTDATLWRPLARQIMTARPDQTGAYKMRGLPAGAYYVALVDPTEQGEWFEPAYLDEHRAGASRVVLGDGDVKTQDFKVK